MTITVNPVTLGLNTYYTAVQTLTVSLAAGAHGNASVNYANAVSDSMRVASDPARFSRLVPPTAVVTRQSSSTILAR